MATWEFVCSSSQTDIRSNANIISRLCIDERELCPFSPFSLDPSGIFRLVQFLMCPWTMISMGAMTSLRPDFTPPHSQPPMEPLAVIGDAL